MAGDVEENPGPDTRSSSQTTDLTEITKLLRDLHTRTIDLQNGQDILKNSISDVSQKQDNIDQKLAEIGNRLISLEEKTVVIDGLQATLQTTQQTVHSLQQECQTLHSRLNDAEDRSRRDNLIFYGIAESSPESFHDAEHKVVTLVSQSLNINLSTDSIVRAHRLGRASSDRNRPMIVKFCSYKTKSDILAKRANLKNSNISLSEDFCPATRIARKSLLEFAKTQGGSSQLKYNKLFLNGKCYMYDQTTKTVVETTFRSFTPTNAASTNQALPGVSTASPNFTNTSR